MGYATKQREKVNKLTTSYTIITIIKIIEPKTEANKSCESINFL